MDEEKTIKLSEIRPIVEETAGIICDLFCKFSGMGDDEGCCWCHFNNGVCPLDKLVKAVEK